MTVSALGSMAATASPRPRLSVALSDLALEFSPWRPNMNSIQYIHFVNKMYCSLKKRKKERNVAGLIRDMLRM